MPLPWLDHPDRIESTRKWLEILARERPLSEDVILTISEVAALLRISEKSAYKLAQAGDLPAFKVGNQWRFRRSELDAWIDSQRRQRSASDMRDEQ